MKKCYSCKYFEVMASGDGWCEIKDDRVGTFGTCQKHEPIEDEESEGE